MTTIDIMRSKKKIYPKIVPLNLGEFIVKGYMDSTMSFQTSKGNFISELMFTTDKRKLA